MPTFFWVWVGWVCVSFLSGLLPSCVAMTLIALMACRPLETVTFRDSLRGMAMFLCDLENAENEYVSNALKMLSHDFVSAHCSLLHLQWCYSR